MFHVLYIFVNTIDVYFSIADGEDRLQIWRVAADVLNKQSRRADKGRSSNFGVGRGAKNSSP
jgi:hypothetical protein